MVMVMVMEMVMVDICMNHICTDKSAVIAVLVIIAIICMDMAMHMAMHTTRLHLRMAGYGCIARKALPVIQIVMIMRMYYQK